MVVGLSPAASAHPLGNATVNLYDGLHLYTDHITDLAVEDVSEIPTLQRKNQVDTDGTGSVSDAERSAYAAKQCSSLAVTNKIGVNGARLTLTVAGSDYTERPGVIALVVGRLVCDLVARLILLRRRPCASIAVGTATASAGTRSPRSGPAPHWRTRRCQRRASATPCSAIPTTCCSLDQRAAILHVVPGAAASSYAAARKIPVAGVAVRELNKLSNAFNRGGRQPACHCRRRPARGRALDAARRGSRVPARARQDHHGGLPGRATRTAARRCHRRCDGDGDAHGGCACAGSAHLGAHCSPSAARSRSGFIIPGLSCSGGKESSKRIRSGRRVGSAAASRGVWPASAGMESSSQACSYWRAIWPSIAATSGSLESSTFVGVSPPVGDGMPARRMASPISWAGWRPSSMIVSDRSRVRRVASTRSRRASLLVSTCSSSPSRRSVARIRGMPCVVTCSSHCGAAGSELSLIHISE